MANYTIAQGRTAGIFPGAADLAGSPGFVMIDYEFDGLKRTTVAADTIDIFEVPAFAGLFVYGAGITVVRAGTATNTLSLSLGAAAAAGTDITGLTAWAGDAVANTKLLKLATAANSIISTATSNFLKLKFNTAAAGSGKYRVRVHALLLDCQSGTPV